MLKRVIIIENSIALSLAVKIYDFQSGSADPMKGKKKTRFFFLYYFFIMQAYNRQTYVE